MPDGFILVVNISCCFVVITVSNTTTGQKDNGSGSNDIIVISTGLFLQLIKSENVLGRFFNTATSC